MSSHVRWLIFILLLALFCVWVALPDTQGIHIDTDGDGTSDLSLNVQQNLGLDLVGGLRVLLQSQLPPDAFTQEDLRTTANNVTRRVNALGVGEATVQIQGNNRILVELPGVQDPQQAIDTIQRTALLEFVDFGGLSAQAQQLVGRKILTTEQVLIQEQRQANTPETTLAPSAETSPESPEAANNGETPPAVEEQALLNPATGQPFQTVMTGAGLQAAAAGITQDGRWEIQFELTAEGGKVFGPFTGSRIGQPLAIVLDGIVLSAPSIQAQLDTGGVITGSFTEQEAKTLALQLRSGALPIPLEVISSETVGATLGQESVNLSIRAGVIGVFIILAFMTINYRVPGAAASLALLVFILLNMALFKLIPITLTLPAIVGFLISIGSAVDGNILIFERLREELRANKDIDAAVTEGFARAWNSIRDSNISTILISGVLFLFGQTPGASVVSGFAVTLALGLMLNLFTAIIVTRTFLYVLLAIFKKPAETRKWLMGI
ncbi:MAG: protein translocase subunit SecD [Chloroflexi bacterium]|nr:protein translocase subunit SecD [Chloroflexota bacterium]